MCGLFDALPAVKTGEKDTQKGKEGVPGRGHRCHNTLRPSAGDEWDGECDNKRRLVTGDVTGRGLA